MVAVLLLPLLGGNLILKRISIAALASLGSSAHGSGTPFNSTIRTLRRYFESLDGRLPWSPPHHTLPGRLLADADCHYAGHHFFAFSMDLFHACAISLFAIFGYATMGALITFGVVPDPGSSPLPSNHGRTSLYARHGSLGFHLNPLVGSALPSIDAPRYSQSR